MAEAAKLGGGRYDALADTARAAAGARAVVLLVIDGEHGSGFTVQELIPAGGRPQIVGAVLVKLLRSMADSIEAGAPPSGVTSRTM